MAELIPKVGLKSRLRGFSDVVRGLSLMSQTTSVLSESLPVTRNDGNSAVRVLIARYTNLGFK